MEEQPTHRRDSRTIRFWKSVCACPPVGRDNLPHKNTTECNTIRLVVSEESA